MDRGEVKMDNVLQAIIDIDPSNEFLKYIVKRIQRDDYRGIHISQHNRYDMDYLENILKSIKAIVGENEFKIPPGDYKRDEGFKLQQEYLNYKEIVDLLNEETERSTYNSVKKNFFVDFDRLGLLDRFDKDHNKIEKGKRKSIHYAQLTKVGMDLASEDDIVKRYKLFTDALDDLFDREISKLVDTLYYSKYKNTAISIYEFMFILSDIYLSSEKKINLINEYRSLEKYKRTNARNLLREYANPKNYTGDKSNKRDFHNWKNESQQLFGLLKITVYFEVAENRFIRLNVGGTGLFVEEQLKRKQSVKIEYFSYHGIDKNTNFELHHIIPIRKARNKPEFELIDNVKNLVYLSKSKHKEITKNHDKNAYLCINQKKVALLDFQKNAILAENSKDAFYSEEQKTINQMISHNRKLLKQAYEYDKNIDCSFPDT